MQNSYPGYFYVFMRIAQACSLDCLWYTYLMLDNTQSSQALTHSQWQTVDIFDLYLDTADDIHVVLQDGVAE